MCQISKPGMQWYTLGGLPRFGRDRTTTSKISDLETPVSLDLAYRDHSVPRSRTRPRVGAVGRPAAGLDLRTRNTGVAAGSSDQHWRCGSTDLPRQRCDDPRGDVHERLRELPSLSAVHD